MAASPHRTSRYLLRSEKRDYSAAVRAALHDLVAILTHSFGWSERFAGLLFLGEFALFYGRWVRDSFGPIAAAVTGIDG